MAVPDKDSPRFGISREMKTANYGRVGGTGYRKIRDTSVRTRRSSHKNRVEESFGGKIREDISHQLLKLLLITTPILILTVLWINYVLRDDQSQELAQIKPSSQQQTVAKTPQWIGLQPKQIAENFLNATTHEERMRWVRKPMEVESMVARYYSSGPGIEEKMSSIRSIDDLATEEGLIARFSVEMENGSERLLFVPYHEGGGLGVDFKSYCIHGNQAWNEVLNGSVDHAEEMRVNLEPTDYYNYAFHNENEWCAFVATSPDLKEPVYLYAKRKDPSMNSLINYPFQSPLRFTISFEKSGDSHTKRQWRLTKVNFPGWVEPTTEL